MPERIVSLMRDEDELLRKVPVSEALERVRAAVEAVGADGGFTDVFSFRVWPSKEAAGELPSVAGNPNREGQGG